MKRIFPLLWCLCLGSLIASTGRGAGEAKTRPPVVTVRLDHDTCRAVDMDEKVLLVDKDAAKVIDAAIRAVAQASRGGTVLIEEGTYIIHSPVKMETGVRLVGEGGLVTDGRPADRYPTILRAGQAHLLAVVDMFEARGARLEHLEVDAAGLADNCVKSAGYAIRIRDCVIRNGAKRGVWITGGADTTHDSYVQGTLINCLIDQGGKGIGVDCSWDPAVKRGGTRGGNFTDGMIYRCRIRNANEAGAVIGGGWQFLHNRVSCANMLAGLVVGSGYAMITDNLFENHDGNPGILIRASNVTVTGNRFTGGSGTPIEVAGGNQTITLSGNERGNAGGAFVKFSGKSDYLSVFDNADRLGAEPDWLLEEAKPQSHAAIDAWVRLSGGKCVATGANGQTIASDSDASKVLNTAIAMMPAPGTVFVAAGTYLIRSPIRMKAGMLLTGAGGMNSAGTGFEAWGTILQAADSCKTAVVDMTEAHGARLEQIAVDGNGVPESCVKLAGRNARISDCFIERAGKQAVWITNGDDASPGAYDGMTMADTLIHAGKATCLVVSRDAAAKGAAPANGMVINSRLKQGQVQAVYAGGPGWQHIGNHSTSGRGSVFGIEVRSDSMLIAGNYFDTVGAGARLRVAGKNLRCVGNHFQKTPNQYSTVLIEPGADNLSILGSTWNTAPDSQTRKYFAEFLGALPSNTVLLGNVGRGAGFISNVTQASASFRSTANSLRP